MNEKDWTGNKKAVWSTLGASNHTEKERENDDFYATSPDTLDLLTRKYQIPHVVMEPACGEGHLSRWLTDHGHKVYSYDIVDRGYGQQQNFFEMLTVPDDCQCILTNPPYKCYDSETECYTKRGWLRYDAVRNGDEVLSVNPYTQELEWSGINKIIIRNIEPDETMYHFKRSHMDVMVTNGHRMFCKSNMNGRLAVRNGDLIKSEDIRSTHYIPRIGYKWAGCEVDSFVLPGMQGHRHAQPCYKEPLCIRMDDWLDFFGLWLADGCCRHTMNSQGNPRKTVCIKQLASNADRIRRALDRLPFDYKEKVDDYNRDKNCINFVIHNEQLWSYLLQFGKASDKYVPDEIKNLSARQLELFLSAYHDGDGSTCENGEKFYRSASKRLIEDVQEILLKLGCLSHVTTSKYSTQDGSKTLYSIRTTNVNSIYNHIFFPSNKGGKCHVEYSGVVWCLNLKKNGVFLLRRNGHEFFCGNCATEFVLHALELLPEGGQVVMFLKTTFLETERRYNEIFKIAPPKHVFQFIRRAMCAKNADFAEARKQGSAVSYCWMVFEKNYKGPTIVDWI